MELFYLLLDRDMRSASRSARFTLAKQPPVRIEQEVWWAQESVWTFCKRKDISGSNQTPDRPVRSLVTICMLTRPLTCLRYHTHIHIEIKKAVVL